MSEYREGLIAALRTRDNDTVIAGCVAVIDGAPRFYVAHPRFEAAFTLPLDDTDKYRIEVFDQTLSECRSANEGFDLCFRFAERVLEFPDVPASEYPLTTAAIWTLQSGCVDPRLLVDPAQTPEWLHQSLPPLIEKANDLHLEFMGMLAEDCCPRVLN